MSEPLQAHGYRESPYIRPVQKWVCGHAAEGCPCQIGPDDSGHCRGGYECSPARVGDRWHCSRSQLSGGPCADGPDADGTCCRQVPLCRPVRSWRAKRGAVTKWVVAMVAALLIFVLAGSNRTALIDPGALSSQHAELLDCGSCHGAFHQGLTGWWKAAWSNDVAAEDSKPCIACHKMGENGLLPHSLPREALAALSQSAAPATGVGPSVGVQLANFAYPNTQQHEAVLPCMTCHQEHQGAEADLTTMSDDRCTSCHQVQFKSLASGHPDFANFPYQRRTKLQFDHTSHIDKHFRDQNMAKLAPGDCRDCHKADANGRLMQVKSFETSCGACHGEQVAGAGRASAKGMAVFAVPGLDVASLRERGAAIGEWPEFAEDTAPPFMNLLLSAAPAYRAARPILANISDPLDLSEASDEQVAAVEAMVWAVKSLLYDLRADGVSALHGRMEAVLGRPLTAVERSSLTALLPLDTIANAQGDWFPALGAEIPRWRAGEKVPMPAENNEETASAPAADVKESDRDEKEDDDDEIATGKDDDDDDNDEITGKDDDDDDDEEEDSDQSSVGTKVVMETASGEDWNLAGGWYRDEFTLRYRPTGHADGFILAWLNLTGELAGELPESARVFENLASPKAPGLCVKCHSVDEVKLSAAKKFTVNWQAYKPEDGLKTAVHFSHSAHFSLLGDKGCMTCHVRDDEADFAAGFTDRNPATFNANFKPLTRQVCAECHTPDMAGDKCLSCHNYHLGIYKPVMAHTKGMYKEAAKEQ